MIAGINVCIFDLKPCLQGLIFAVSLGPVNCLGEACTRFEIFTVSLATVVQNLVILPTSEDEYVQGHMNLSFNFM